MFWLILMLIVLCILLVLLYRRVKLDSRVKLSREEMPGKVSVMNNNKKPVSIDFDVENDFC